jgi:hypothetical protein
MRWIVGKWEKDSKNFWFGKRHEIWQWRFPIAYCPYPMAYVCVPSNIAEGDERDTNKDAIRFFFIAKGSLAELRTQLDIALRIDYISEEVFQDLEGKAVLIGKMLGSLIKSRSLSHSPLPLFLFP